MKFVKYSSKGNSIGLDDNIVSYWQINVQGEVIRSIEIQSNGELLKYLEEHQADSYGQLPEGIITNDNLNNQSYGTCEFLTESDFDKMWSKKAINFN
ncbi:hypothetical protein [Pseudoalteromonas luteoviolacea]|uniref:hypothetical protein n=1 Tax=Pseudoalteromonas luteoviolacea TaxID=43657 RepID=UPI0007B07977|nr:hypothetical protein [Pseudoalteromonas luteoviolacea]